MGVTQTPASRLTDAAMKRDSSWFPRGPMWSDFCRRSPFPTRRWNQALATHSFARKPLSFPPPPGTMNHFLSIQSLDDARILALLEDAAWLKGEPP